MNIAMFTDYFPPEVGSASNLFYELGAELTLKGHRVTVFTGFPKYNVDIDTLPSRYRKRLWLKEVMKEMQIIRMRTLQMPRHILTLRGLDQITTSIAFLFSALFLASHDIDIVLIYSPPLFLGFTGIALRCFTKAKVVLNVQDLFPQSAIDLGVLKNKILIALLRTAESRLYRSVNAVTVHSPGNKEYVIHCGAHESRTSIVHNPVDVRSLTPGGRMNSFRERYQIAEETFIVSFAGVIGYSQDLDVVIDTAKILEDKSRIIFYIVGDGVEKERLLRKAGEMRNIRFLPMISRPEYAELLRASDIGLVTLRRNVMTPVVPSKILSIMASGRPIVASLPQHGDAPVIIREAECGLCTDPENPRKLAEAIEYLFENPDAAARYGSNGRDYAVKQFSLEACVEAYEKLFREVISNNKDT